MYIRRLVPIVCFLILQGCAKQLAPDLHAENPKAIALQEGRAEKESVDNAGSKNLLPEIKHCYESQLVRNPKLEGKVVVHMTIQSNGMISKVEIKETTLNDSLVENCILYTVSKAQFPKNIGGTVEVFYPFAFKVAKN